MAATTGQAIRAVRTRTVPKIGNATENGRNQKNGSARIGAKNTK
jgi:hypothetical protein